MAYIGRKPTDAPLTSADIQNGSITNDDLAAGVAIANIGYTPESSANKNAANGYAGLDGSGKVAAAQLPSYVDDVLEYADQASFPGTGEASKIYVALDSNKTYRWSGSGYIEISPSPGTTDSLTEGSTNLYFTQARSRNALSATQNISYDAATGVFTGPNLSGFLESSTAASTYQPLSGMSSYLTTSAAGSTYLTQENAASTYAPVSTTVTLAGTQTLTNKTFTGYTETVYNLTGTDISPANGTIQYVTLAANRTFTESLADGQSVTLMINPATFAPTWPTTTWVGSVTSTAPTLVASVYNCITFFKFGGVFYGKYEGRV